MPVKTSDSLMALIDNTKDDECQCRKPDIVAEMVDILGRAVEYEQDCNNYALPANGWYQDAVKMLAKMRTKQ